MATAGAPVVDDVFGVLAHPLRRELLQRLAHREARASDLAQRLPVSRSAVSQHLRLMLTVGVVTERRDGRERYYSLRDGLAEVDDWLARLDDFWAASLQNLARHVDGVMIDEHGNVLHEVRFAAPIEHVWDALVDPAALEQWLGMPNDFVPRVGRRFRLDAGPPRGIIEAEVLDLDPPQRMQWSWLIDGVATTVTITLRAGADGTVLTLVHSDLPADPRPRFDAGWVDKFESLTKLLEGAA